MFDAQLLFAGANPQAGIRVYSPWTPKKADHLRATLEVVHIIPGCVIEVEIWTKNTEDGGDGTNADAAAATIIVGNVQGRQTLEWFSAGNITLKELVRYRFTVTGQNVTDWVLFRMLPIVWFDAVQA